MPEYKDDTFQIELAPPPRALSPNARGRRARIAAVAAYRDSVCARAMEVLGRDEGPRWAGAEADVTFYVRDHRTRDPDNLAAMLKPAWDGLVRAGVLQDDAALSIWPLLILVDRQRQRVEIRLLHQPNRPLARSGQLAVGRPPAPEGARPATYAFFAAATAGLWTCSMTPRAPGYMRRLAELRACVDTIYPPQLRPRNSTEPAAMLAWALRHEIDRRLKEARSG